MNSSKPCPDSEYEIRILDWDPSKVLKAARALGAAARPQRSLLINTIYTMPGKNNNIIARVRESISRKRVTSAMTVKAPDAERRYDLESETEVSDPSQAKLMLEMLGLERKHTTQKFRDVLEIPDMGRLDIDHHPGLPPVLEVEAPTEAKLSTLLSRLNLHDVPLPSVNTSKRRPEELYHTRFGVPTSRRPEGDVTFDNPGDIARHVKKNRVEFERILFKQREEANRLLKTTSAMR